MLKNEVNALDNSMNNFDKIFFMLINFLKLLGVLVGLIIVVMLVITPLL
tara:strand:- start:376 stop:522 length:147 start_codon:yes stop_codon:yes gene_type:complete